MCDQPLIKITPDSSKVPFLTRGPIEMSYSAVIPYWWMKKGNYTVHVEMNATDGARMTGFEGTVWVNGEVGGDPGWPQESVSWWK